MGTDRGDDLAIVCVRGNAGKMRRLCACGRPASAAAKNEMCSQASPNAVRKHTNHAHTHTHPSSLESPIHNSKYARHDDEPEIIEDVEMSRPPPPRVYGAPARPQKGPQLPPPGSMVWIRFFVPGFPKGTQDPQLSRLGASWRVPMVPCLDPHHR